MSSPQNRDESVKGTIKLELSPLGEESIGGMIGPYKLLEQVGEGGFGVVYVAEQREPVKRRVALKIIKLGMDTRQVVARFEAERQALALMDHPNIAKVFDAGATEKGRPYFAMELVRGVPITRYCDQERVNTRDRLELFIKVCQAIQHAHQKGIIHRDIKPSNILVTLHDGVPVPKVIDFGIAKATQQDLTDKTLYTQLQQFIGTPAYMSPEQAEMSGLDIDTRSDIYSLGVLLYELLTGRTPFDPKELMKEGVDGMRKAIREKEPVRPSTKVATLQGEELSTTAARHSVHPPKLVTSLRGDLDWIVMKCLEKDRTRRYETANGLAFDIRRHLNNETVMARPPSAAYRFQKAFRRNKLVYSAGIAVFVALIVGLGAASAMFLRARQALAGEQVQRLRAEANEKKATVAQAEESQLRQQAQVAELAARRRAYASDMNAAKQALDANNLGHALELLDRQRPEPGQLDLRGWEWRYLWQQTRSDALFTFCHESRPISSLAVSADGDFLATGEFGKGAMVVWDARTRRELFRAPYEVWGSVVAFSPVEPLLAYSVGAVRSADNVGSDIHLWRASTRQAILDVPMDGNCLAMMFSADGQTLLTSTAEPRGGELTLFRVADGKRIATWPVRQPGLGAQAHAFAATPDLRLAAYGAPEKFVRVIDLRDGRELWSAEASNLRVTALAISPDQKLLASAAGYEEKDIRLWDMATGRQLGRLEGHSEFVSSLLFLPDGKRLVSTSLDGTIRIWDVASLQPLDVLRGHRQGVCNAILLPDNRTLISASMDGAALGWDTTVSHLHDRRITLADNITTYRFTPDSRSLTTVDREGRVTRWSGMDYRHSEHVMDVASNDMVRGPNLRWYHILSRDAQYLAIGSTNGALQLWDIGRRSLSHRFAVATAHLVPLALLDAGRKLITGEPGELHEWDLETGAEIQAWPSGWDPVCLSPDESCCVSFADAERLCVRNLNERSARQFAAPDALYGRSAFSPDGRQFAIAAPTGSYLSIWDAATWKQTETLTNGLTPMTRSIAFSADSKRLFIGRGVGQVQIWDVDGGQPIVNLESAGGETVETSPDGNTVAVLESGGTLHLWRAPSWEEIAAAEGASKSPVAAAPRGSSLSAGDSYQTEASAPASGP